MATAMVFDESPYHRPGLVKQDKYFQIGLGGGEGPHRTPAGLAF